MPLHHPNGSVTAPEWSDLDKKLRTGDGLMWTGDPRLWLGIGVLENKVTRKTGRRLEVWRDNEDGTTSMIGHWLPTEQYRVLYDLANMRADRPNAVSVEDRIDKHNDALEKAATEKATEATIEMLDHAIRLEHDRNNPRQKFFLNGDPNRGARA